MTEKVLTHESYYSNKKRAIDSWKVSDSEKESVKQFIEAYELGKITRRTATNSHALIERLLCYLKFSLEHIKKDSPADKDLEAFTDNLLKDIFRGHNKKTLKYDGAPYSTRNKSAILDALTKFYKWKFPKKTSLTLPLGIKLYEKTKEPPCLSPEQIDALYRGCASPEERYFIAVLFSSGARAEEFHNIRFSDILLPKKEESFVKVRLRNEYSKTAGRTVVLYYKNALEAVREFLEERKQQGIKIERDAEEPVFIRKYNRQKDLLDSLGKRVLRRRVNYHLFRHSCAAWIAHKLNRQQLCVFFGWKFNSPMPDVYIKRDAVEMNDATEKFETTELEELKIKADKSEYTMKEQAEELHEFRKVLLEAARTIIRLRPGSEFSEDLLKLAQAK